MGSTQATATHKPSGIEPETHLCSRPPGRATCRCRHSEPCSQCLLHSLRRLQYKCCPPAPCRTQQASQRCCWLPRWSWGQRSRTLQEQSLGHSRHLQEPHSRGNGNCTLSGLDTITKHITAKLWQLAPGNSLVPTQAQSCCWQFQLFTHQHATHLAERCPAAWHMRQMSTTQQTAHDSTTQHSTDSGQHGRHKLVAGYNVIGGCVSES